MKRLIVAILVLAMCGVLFAQASPFSFYGSVRAGFFYDMKTFAEDSVVDPASEDPENPDYIDGRLMLNDGQYLQGNARFGANYKKDNLTGKIEFGFANNAELRLLYGKYDFEGWSLLAGKDYDGTNMLSNQTYNNDLGLNGYGAIDGGRNPQIKFGFFDDAFYFALIKGSYMYWKDPEDLSEGLESVVTTDGKGPFDTIIPKINLGYKWEINDDMNLHPTAMLQMFNMNKDFSGYDESIMSFLVGITYDWKINDDMKLRVHGNFGQNTANMGFKETVGVIHNPDPEDEDALEAHDVTSMGGYLTFNMNFTESFGFGIGVGYAQTSIADAKYQDADGEEVDWADDRMAFYLQLPYKTAGNFTITPEFGMHMEMKDSADKDQGSDLYFGAQLRYDF